MEKSKKVGIIGGTFNPIHFGHLMMAEHAYSEFDLDEILFMPTGRSYFKDDSVLDKKIRSNMTSIAIGDNPHFVLSTIETDKEGNSYTYETLEDLIEANPDVSYYFICGADSLFQIENWRCPDRIFKAATLLVATRDDKAKDELLKKADELKNRYDAKIEVMNFPRVEISSTDIRNRVSKGLSVKYMLPDGVIDYINEQGFYRD